MIYSVITHIAVLLSSTIWSDDLVYEYVLGTDVPYCYYPAMAGITNCETNKKIGNNVKIKKLIDHSSHYTKSLVSQNLYWVSDAPKLIGIPKVTDGDTIKLGKTRIRLFGIDAPEMKQECTLDGQIQNCGIKARNALLKVIGEKEVRCEEIDRDRYGRVVAECFADSINLNAYMVREGWALAYIKYSKAYKKEESIARSERIGLWSGIFTPPWDWRRSRRSRH